MITSTEENYLKAIYKIAEKEKKSASTSSISKNMKTTAASVTDMLRKLSEKGWINYEKYKGVTLTSEGAKITTNLIRRHRLWEVFLVNKLRFSWHQVHDLAEELEHIHSPELVSRLDAFLDYPKFDPHGDPIPNAEGKFTLRTQMPLSDIGIGKDLILLGVKESGTEFLKHLNKLKIKLGTKLKILKRTDFDGTLVVRIDDKEDVIITEKVAHFLLVKAI
jgi:DtxR family Mn-dependent transcriptional regulator